MWTGSGGTEAREAELLMTPDGWREVRAEAGETARRARAPLARSLASPGREPGLRRPRREMSSECLDDM